MTEQNDGGKPANPAGEPAPANWWLAYGYSDEASAVEALKGYPHLRVDYTKKCMQLGALAKRILPKTGQLDLEELEENMDKHNAPPSNEGEKTSSTDNRIIRDAVASFGIRRPDIVSDPNTKAMFSGIVATVNAEAEARGEQLGYNEALLIAEQRYNSVFGNKPKTNNPNPSILEVLNPGGNKSPGDNAKVWKQSEINKLILERPAEYARLQFEIAQAIHAGTVIKDV